MYLTIYIIISVPNFNVLVFMFRKIFYIFGHELYRNIHQNKIKAYIRLI